MPVIFSYAGWRWQKSGLQVLTLREQRLRLNRNPLHLVEAHLVAIFTWVLSRSAFRFACYR
jgi:hypothetical protein